MAIERKDRVSDTTTTTGTGTVTLTGTAPTGYRSVSAAHTDGATVRYAISMGSEWEVGEGVYTASGTTLSRATVLASSNSGSLVNFSAGTKTVVTTLTASEVGSFAVGPFTAWTSGAYKDISGLPSGTKRFKVKPVAMSTNGTSVIIVQLGDAGGIETSGYTGTVETGGARSSFSFGIMLTQGGSAAFSLDGELTFELADSSTNTWTCSGVMSGNNSAAASYSISGAKALSGELTQFRVTTVGGTNTGDAGGFGYSVEV